MAQDDESPSKSPFTPGFVASAVMIGAIALVGVVVVALVLWPGSDDDAVDTAEPEPSAESSPPADREADGDESMCGLPASDETELTEPPAGTEWEVVGTMPAPSLEEAGPGMTDDDGVRQCYAHSPEGALMAAANVLAMGTDPDLAYPMNEVMVSEGQGRDAALAELEQQGLGDTGGMRTEVAGFNILGYGPDHARVDLAMESSTGMFASMTTDLLWEEGDWKERMNTEGQPFIPVAQIPDASGYIPWSAEG